MSKVLTPQLVGWLQALAAVLVFLGLGNVFGRYSVVVYDTNPMVYSCVAFATAALLLLLYAGKGPLGRETMRSIDTWVYGVILMGSYIFGLLLFAYVTSTEGTILQKISVLLSLFASWFFMARQPDRYQLMGVAAITVGVALVCAGLERETIGIVAILALIYGGLQAARIFTAELHRPHAAAAKQKDPKSKARVISFVMFTMSCIFIGLCLFLATIQHLQGSQLFHFAPQFSDFTHPPTVFLGMMMGGLIIVPLRVLEFSSAYTIKAENFTTVTAFSALGTMFWEWVSGPLTALSIQSLTGLDVLAACFITLGALFIALTRPLASRRPKGAMAHLIVSTQDVQAVMDSRDVLADTLEHFNGNIKRAAQALNVPQKVIHMLIEDKERKYAFKNFESISRRYRTCVSGVDALTGLLNRGYFAVLAKRQLQGSKQCFLFYVDLDKFKPVNDTYGHQAGDAVLQETARRLEKTLPPTALVARIGGDEFAMLTKGKVKQEETAEKIKQALAQPIELPSAAENVTVGGSVGIAKYPEGGKTLDELLAFADQNMYKAKMGSV